MTAHVYKKIELVGTAQLRLTSNQVRYSLIDRSIE